MHNTIRCCQDILARCLSMKGPFGGVFDVIVLSNEKASRHHTRNQYIVLQISR